MQARSKVLERIAESLAFYRSAATAMGEEQGPGLSRVVDVLGAYYERVAAATDAGAPVAWINFGVATELFWAMDIVPVVTDVMSGLLAPTLIGGHALEYIDRAEEHVPSYVCSSNKTLLGAALAGDVATPHIMVHPSHPCDSNLATYPVMARYFDYPYYCVDMPYLRDERALEYVADQLRELVSVLENATGRRLDIDRLREAMQHSNAAHEILLRIAELRRSVPCPFSSLEVWGEYPLVLSLAGRPELVDFLETAYEAAQARLAAHTSSSTASAERLRLAWIYGAPAFDLLVFPWLEQQHGAVSVANMNSNFVMKPAEDITDARAIFRALAQKMILLPMSRECGGPWENYGDAAVDLCRRFRADTAIFCGHVACKANWAIVKLFKDRLLEELGLPTLVLELDLFDPRVCSDEALKSQLSEFLTVVVGHG